MNSMFPTMTMRDANDALIVIADPSFSNVVTGVWIGVTVLVAVVVLIGVSLIDDFILGIILGCVVAAGSGFVFSLLNISLDTKEPYEALSEAVSEYGTPSSSLSAATEKPWQFRADDGRRATCVTSSYEEADGRTAYYVDCAENDQRMVSIQDF